MLYADDQFVNQASIKRQFYELSIVDKLKLVSDGQQVVDYFEQYLSAIDLGGSTTSVTI